MLATSSSRIGVLGGTFNPVHNGHISIARDVQRALSLSELWFVPAKIPPLKDIKELIPEGQRLSLLEAAIKHEKCWKVSDLEYKRHGPSYTVITLKEIIKTFDLLPMSIYFIVGVDAFLEIERWWNYKELFQLANFAVVTRPGWDEAERDAMVIAEKLGFCYNSDKREISLKESRNQQEVVNSTSDSNTPETLAPGGISCASSCTSRSVTDSKIINPQQCPKESTTHYPCMIANYKNTFGLTLSLIRVNPVDVSSTMIRELLAKKISIRDFVPEAVNLMLTEEERRNDKN